MSDPQPQNEVVPLWRMPMEQKDFAAWSRQLGSGDAAANGFARYAEPDPADAAAPQERPPSGDAEIFDIAYKKGWEDCEAALAEEKAVNDDACQRLTDALQHITTLQSAGSYEFILQAVEQLFERCAAATAPERETLQAWAQLLASYVDQDQKSASLLLHPDDLELIDKKSIGLPLLADDRLPRGNLRLSHAGGWIEKGSAVVLDELRNLIDEIHEGGGASGA